VDRSKARVLVVDDDADIRDALNMALTEEGYDAHGVEDGEKALEWLRREPPPNVILLDMMMPRMNGWQFRNAQRADPQLAEIPVIVVSAAADNALRAAGAAKALEVDAVLRKPVDLDELFRAVERAVR
jgi:CheY-like chemotaxis protein